MSTHRWKSAKEMNNNVSCHPVRWRRPTASVIQITVKGTGLAVAWQGVRHEREGSGAVRAPSGVKFENGRIPSSSRTAESQRFAQARTKKTRRGQLQTSLN